MTSISWCMIASTNASIPAEEFAYLIEVHTNRLLDVRLECLGLGELALHMCREPYLRQGPAAGEDRFGVELTAEVLPDGQDKRSTDIPWVSKKCGGGSTRLRGGAGGEGCRDAVVWNMPRSTIPPWPLSAHVAGLPRLPYSDARFESLKRAGVAHRLALAVFPAVLAIPMLASSSRQALKRAQHKIRYAAAELNAVACTCCSPPERTCPELTRTYRRARTAKICLRCSTRRRSIGIS